MLFAQTKMGDTCALGSGQVCALEKNILGSYSSSVELNPVVAQLIFTGAVQVADLITHRFPLEQVNQAIDLGPASLGRLLENSCSTPPRLIH